MNITYKLIEGLAPLAWIAYCNKGNVEVIHGKDVECTENFFVEGAWNDVFQKGTFCESDWFCGTGARIENDQISFSTPTHVTHGLYSFREMSKNFGGGYWLSNSLPLLLVKCDLKLDSQYLFYERDFNTILFGIHDYKKDIYVLDKNDKATNVQLHYFRNITITDNNDFIIQVKPSMRAFKNFDDYYKSLLCAMDLLYQNARDKGRKKKYGMVTTISKGYDAPCCAAIGKKLGCDTAVTFKAEGKYKEDSGVEIAKQLGYKKIIERDAEEYKNREDFVEAFYIASGELGAQISFSAFDSEFKGNVVLTGERGDSIWSKNAENRNNEFAFEDILSHLGSCERKLWVGYISVPMPLYGASAWKSIYQISNAKDMQVWQLNSEYDRPIPRRIIEEAGVTRESFGQAKHGAGFIYRYDWLGRIKNRMSKTTAKDFSDYVKENYHIHLLQKIKYFWNTKELYLSRIGIRIKQKKAVEYSQIANPMAARYLMPWAVDIVKDKYKKSLGVLD